MIYDTDYIHATVNPQLPRYIQNPFLLDLGLDKTISDPDVPGYSLWRVTAPQAFEGSALSTLLSPAGFRHIGLLPGTNTV